MAEEIKRYQAKDLHGGEVVVLDADHQRVVAELQVEIQSDRALQINDAAALNKQTGTIVELQAKLDSAIHLAAIEERNMVDLLLQMDELQKENLGLTNMVLKLGTDAEAFRNGEQERKQIVTAQEEEIAALKQRAEVAKRAVLDLIRGRNPDFNRDSIEIVL